MPPFSKFFGRTISEAAGFALGGAIRSPLEPPLVELTNETWLKFVEAGVTVPTDAGDAAEIAAEDVATVEWAKGQAAQRGVGGDQMDKLIGAALNAPGVPELLTLWRRGLIDQPAFEHGLRKARLEARWDDKLEALKAERLDPAIITTAIQRGLMSAPFDLPYTPPAGVGNVQPFPESSLDTQAELDASGIDAERARIMTGLIGLPMALDRAAQAHFRGILTEDDYLRAVLEGNARGEWAGAELDVARQILTASEYQEAALRGVLSLGDANAKTAQHGMSDEDAAILYAILGRPLSVHQITTGLARGGTYGGTYDDVPEPYRDAIRRSNVRPEYAVLDHANRYSYPSAFFFRLLATTGALKQPELEQAFLELGWSPKWAKLISEALTAAKSSAQKEATAADILVLWDGAKLAEPEALAALEALGYSAEEAQRKMDVLEARRVAGAKQSALGDLHTAYKKGGFSEAAAVTALEGLGLSATAAGEIVAYWTIYTNAAGSPPTP